MKSRISAAAIVRSVRLTGGMVLMAYVTGHLTNLAFGLVSLDMLDRLRIPLMAPWQSLPCQILLYGAWPRIWPWVCSPSRSGAQSPP
jgi:hypothetical protein